MAQIHASRRRLRTTSEAARCLAGAVLLMALAGTEALVAPGRTALQGAAQKGGTATSVGRLKFSQQERATCGEVPPDRMIVVCDAFHNIGWVPTMLGNIPLAAYSMVPNMTEHRARCPPGKQPEWPADCPAHAAQTLGREASAYCQFIVDHWNALPRKMLFLHGHQWTWHRGPYSPALLRRLHWGALDKLGFSSVRHWGYTDWNCGTAEFGFPCWRLGTFATPRDPEKAASDPHLNPLLGDDPQGGFGAWTKFTGDNLAMFWRRYFQEWLGELPEEVHCPSNHAEFLVTAERVRLRPLEFWQNAVAQMEKPFIREGTTGISVAQAFEQIWHLIFGQPALDHAVSKCNLYYCSDEEKRDPRLVAPLVPKPYRQKFIAPGTSWRATLNNASSAAGAGNLQHEDLWLMYDRHNAPL